MQMWISRTKPDLQGILDRLDRLESTTNLDDITDTLGFHSREIVALRSSEAVFETKYKDLLLAVADGIERVDRAERRVVATIKRARKELQKHGFESTGLEAEAAELRLVNGAGGEEQGMPAVPDDVEESAGQASSVPNVSIKQLQRARGF